MVWVEGTRGERHATAEDPPGADSGAVPGRPVKTKDPIALRQGKCGANGADRAPRPAVDRARSGPTACRGVPALGAPKGATR